jgi:large subunit ribosomal protein L9
MTNKQTKLILRQPVANLGQKGDVVTVAAGYARNFLLPQGYAMAWDKGTARQIEAMQRAQRAQSLASRADASALKEKLDGITVIVSAKVSESGKLFGGISADQIVAALSAKGMSVDPKMLTFDPIRKLGTFSVTAKLHPEISAQFNVQVVKEGK